MPVAMNNNATLIVLAAIGIALTSLGLYRSYTSGYKDTVDADHPIVDRVFRNEVVEIDGKVFRRCTFENVTFVYGARRSCQLQSCTFLGRRLIKAATPEVTATILVLRGLGVNPVDSPLYSNEPLPMVDPLKENKISQ